MTQRVRARHWWSGALVALAVVASGLTFSPPALAALGTVSAGGPYSGAEGSWVQIHGSAPGATTHTWTAVRDPAGEKDSASCQIKNGDTLDPLVSCNDDGWFLVTLKASDGTTTQSDTARITLTNVKPVVTITAPTPGTAVAPHAVVTLNGYFTDPGYVDGHSYIIDWGDGATSRDKAPETQQNGGSGTVTVSHSYGTAGSYTIALTVYEGHPGSTDTDTTSISVVAGTPCARVTGKGRLPHHRRGSSFSFWANCGSSGPVGHVSTSLARHGKLRAGRVTLLRGSGRTATFQGTGRFQKSGHRVWRKHYRYLIKTTDRRRHDWLNVVVRKPNGVVVLRAKGRIPRGHITVRN